VNKVVRKLRSIALPAAVVIAFGLIGPNAAVAQRVILSEDFESDTPDTVPEAADFFARSCVQFVNCATEPAKVVVTGGMFPDPFGPGNQSVLFHNPNSAAQMALTWTSIFDDNPGAFRNGVIEFDVWMQKPLPVLGEPGGKFWAFLDARIGYGGPDRASVSTINDVTIWDNFRIQNLFPPTPDPVENVVDAGAQFTVGLQTTYTDPVPNGLMAPDTSFHVKFEISGTPGNESYVVKVNDTPITWLQDGEMSHPWVPDAPGVNVISFLSDASAFSTGAGASNVYLDNLVVINNDLPPAGLDGDFNNDGKVDAADYVVWRKGLLAGTFGPEDYATWRSNFGATIGSGQLAAQVPEPATCEIFSVWLSLSIVVLRLRIALT
jgi:hypothetical protein